MPTLAEIDAELEKRKTPVSGVSAADIDAELSRRGETDGDLSAVNRFLEPAQTMITGAIAEPIAGLAGIAQAINPFAEPGAGERAVAATREALTFLPRTEEGQAGLEAVGETLAPIGEAFEEAETFLGEKTFEATGSPLLAAAAASIPTAATELIGIAAGKGAIKAGARKSALKTKLAEQIRAGGADKSLSRFIVDGAGKIKTDPFIKEAIKQGFDEGVLAAVKGSTSSDKVKMTQMVKILKKGRENALFAAKNRPSDIAGNSLLERVNHIKRVNVSAGKRLDAVAKSLKGKAVDSSLPVDNFINALDDMGIGIDDNFKPVFAGSIIEDLEGPQNAISRVVKRLAKGGEPDAFDLHRMKKFIDENVTFGKTGEGLGGKTEAVLKSLRRDIDGVLDSSFPKYDKVNTAFSETIGALDSLQSAAGQKLDLFGPNANKAVGTLLRRLMSNAQSRVNLLDSIDDVERVSKKFGGKFKDDISTQMLFVDELNTRFKPAARTSLQGEISKEIERGIARSTTGTVAEGAGRLAEKVRGISDENAIKSIEQLLRSK